MKKLFILILFALSFLTHETTKAQTCHAGQISAEHDSICPGTPATLIDNGSSGNIQWQSATADTFSNITGATDSVYKTNPLLQTTYFRAVVSNGSCADTSGVVTVFADVSLSAYFTYAWLNDTLVFNSDSSKGNIVHYRWDFGDGTTSNKANPTHQFPFGDSIPQSYICLSIYDSLGCSQTFCRYVDIFEYGNCVAVFTFRDSANVVHFYSLSEEDGTWNFGDGTSSSVRNPVHTYDSTGTYNACLYISLGKDCNGNVCHDVSAIVNAVKPISANQQTLAVYPNPVRGQLTVSSERSPITELEILDLPGQTLIQLNTYKTKTQIDVATLAAGIYFVKTQLSDGSVQVRKLVKE